MIFETPWLIITGSESLLTMASVVGGASVPQLEARLAIEQSKSKSGKYLIVILLVYSPLHKPAFIKRQAYTYAEVILGNHT